MLKAFRNAPAPITFLVLSFLCPSELSLYIGGLRFPPHRVAIALLLPFAIARIVQGRTLRLHAYDVLFITYALWTGMTFFIHHGTDSLAFGGSLTLEAMGGYLIARVWIRDRATFTAAIALFVASIVVTGLIAMPETLLHYPFAHEFMKALTGAHHHAQTEVRMGLNRAYGTFDHPIHLGTYCASLLALIWLGTDKYRQRLTRFAIIVWATFLGLSSAPLLSVGVQLAFLCWEAASRGVVKRATITIAAFGFLYLGAMLIANRTPAAFIATTLTLNAQTGYYRMLIWEYGIDNVMASPWIGIGLNDWMRPSWMPSETIDTYWLIITMRSGLPATFMLLLAMILLIVGLWKTMIRSRDPRLRQIATGWQISFIAFVLIASTVHLWNVQHTYFFFFLGLAGWLADPVRQRAGAMATAPQGVRAPAIDPRGRRSPYAPRWAIEPYRLPELPTPRYAAAGPSEPWPSR